MSIGVADKVLTWPKMCRSGHFTGWLGIYNELLYKIRLYDDYPNLVYPQPFINLLLPKYWRSPDDPSNDPSVLTQSRGENSFAHHKNDFKYVELW